MSNRIGAMVGYNTDVDGMNYMLKFGATTVLPTVSAAPISDMLNAVIAVKKAT